MSMINVPISTSKFLELGNFLKEVGSDRDPVGAIEDAIDYWIDNAKWKTADLLPETVKNPAKIGLSWRAKDPKTGATLKPVFLPHGTTLQIKTKTGVSHAYVENGGINYNNSYLRSPNAFAKEATGTHRDAWRDVWVRRPTDKDFVRADDLREINRTKKGA